jgi:DNA-binding MarR family transcriptional regulator
MDTKLPIEAVMQNKLVDSVIENWFIVGNITRKKMLEDVFKDAYRDVSYHHLVIMRVLCESGPLSISAIGKILETSKPQMTRWIDRMVDLGLVERRPDAVDRRVINVALTERGKRIFTKLGSAVKRSFREKLSCLSDEDLKELSASMMRLADILSKLE